MTQLHQIIAVEKGVKTRAAREVTNSYHDIQKVAPLAGIARNYEPKDEEGDRLPSESTLVQIKVDDVLRDIGTSLTRLFDVTLTKEVANAGAKADVRVGETTLLTDVPVTYLLFLDKQLVDIHTIISKLPTLDPAERWQLDPSVGTWATDTIQTTRTKKIPRNWVKAPATDKHPAQVEVYHEDVIVGTWNTRKFSGALPAERKQELLGRVDALITAVKFARETANNTEVDDQLAGEIIFDYLLAE